MEGKWIQYIVDTNHTVKGYILTIYKNLCLLESNEYVVILNERIYHM